MQAVDHSVRKLFNVIFRHWSYNRGNDFSSNSFLNNFLSKELPPLSYFIFSRWISCFALFLHCLLIFERNTVCLRHWTLFVMGQHFFSDLSYNLPSPEHFWSIYTLRAMDTFKRFACSKSSYLCIDKIINISFCKSLFFFFFFSEVCLYLEVGKRDCWMYQQRTGPDTRTPGAHTSGDKS
jgi:hypothetical protein